MVDEFENIIKNEIKPGEEILWRGEPDSKLYFNKGLVRHSIGIVMLLFVIFFYFMISYQSKSTHPLTQPIFILCAVVLIIVIKSKVTLWFKARRSLYLLTSERAIIISTYPKVEVTSYPKDKIIGYNKTYNTDGSGDIIFSGINPRLVGLYKNFIGLKDVKKVSDLIGQVTKK